MPRVGKCPCGAKLALPDTVPPEGITLKCASCGRLLKLNAPRKPAAPPAAPKPEPRPEPKPEPAEEPLRLEDDEPLRLEDDGADDDSAIQADDAGPAITGGLGAESFLADKAVDIDDTEDAFELDASHRAAPAPAAPPAAPTPADGSPAAKCPGCGEPREPGAVICIHCGLNLADGTKANTKVEKGEAAGPSFKDELVRELRDKWKTWGCLIIIVAVAAITVLLMKVF